MKRLLTALLIGLSALGLTMQYSHIVSADLRSGVYRLHVIANSDSSQDQALKLEVRDAVIKTLNNLVGDDATREETEKAANENLEFICNEASRVIKDRGYSYPVTVRTGSFHFPTKNYGEVSLPEGKYDGLQVIIGSGSGQNWWCVLYPNLCFVDGVVSMPEDSTAKLGQSLTDEQMPIVSGDVKLKFKILEIFD